VKIAITGHSSGIGQAIHRQLMISSDDTEFKLFSRDNGYDLALDYQTVIDEIVEWDADVVFNNAWAYGNNAQPEILKALHKKWSDKEKVIINTGSCTAYYWQGEIGDNLYVQDTKELIDYCIRSSVEWPWANKCRCHVVSFGYVQSALVEGSEYYDEFITADEAAEIMIDLIEPKNYLIPEVMVTHKFFDLEKMESVRKITDANMSKSIMKSYK